MRYSRFIFLLVPIALLTGCPKDTVLSLYNHSGTNLVVRTGKGKLQWPNLATLAIDMQKQNIRVKQRSVQTAHGVGSVVEPILDVSDGESIRSYILPLRDVPKSYMQINGNVVIHLRIDPDWHLYLVPPARLKEALEKKPSGFPVSPDQ